jgi:hypothetical protein
MVDVMRKEYRELTHSEREEIIAVKTMGEHFWILLDRLGTSRELSLAKTKIEEAVFWATKHITQ